MKRFLLLFFCLSWFASAAPPSPADLVDGGYTLYFRHAKADAGVDCKDPEQAEWWKSEDSRKTRQLSPDGKRQAQVIGQAFRNLNIPVGRLNCSEFRRAQDTISLMGLGEPLLEPNLTPLVSLGELGPRLRPLLTAAPDEGTNTVLVAHGHVLPEFDDLEEASAVVYRAGESQPLGVISYEDWEKAAGDMIFDSQRTEDRFTLEESVLTIYSSMGIGTVTISPVGEEWPPLRTLRFQYADGSGMKVLEGLRISEGRPNSVNDYRDLLKQVRDGAIEVNLPSELPQSVKSFTIHWVDFYR
jgi:phosphohistidine phosphatase SixA